MQIEDVTGRATNALKPNTIKKSYPQSLSDTSTFSKTDTCMLMHFPFENKIKIRIVQMYNCEDRGWVWLGGGGGGRRGVGG